MQRMQRSWQVPDAVLVLFWPRVPHLLEEFWGCMLVTRRGRLAGCTGAMLLRLWARIHCQGRRRVGSTLGGW